MKKMIVLALALTAFQSHAAKYQSCVDAVRNHCGSTSVLQAIANTSGNACSIVQGGSREDGSHFDTRVVFKDSWTLYSIELNARCDDSVKINLSSPVIEDKQFAGRLFSLTQGGQVIAVGRDNAPVILLNSKNKPYSNVTDLKVDEAGMTLTFDGRDKLVIGTEKMLEQINRPEAKLQTTVLY